jgi:hypothetical protein
LYTTKPQFNDFETSPEVEKSGKTLRRRICEERGPTFALLNPAENQSDSPSTDACANRENHIVNMANFQFIRFLFTLCGQYLGETRRNKLAGKLGTCEQT